MFFVKQTKFRKFALKRKLRFAFFPTYIDGGYKRIWLCFYYDLYERTDGFLNWNMPDIFSPIGGYSFEGAKNKITVLREKNEHYHWAESDYNLFPTYLTPKKCFK